MDNELLPLSELAKRLPCVRGDNPPCRRTLHRWSTVGLKSRNGQYVRLQSRFMGGTLCASLADVQQFNEALDDVDYAPPASPMSVAEQVTLRERGEAAMRRLAARGITLRQPSEFNLAV